MMMLEGKLFHKRVQTLINYWKNNQEEFGNADSLLFVTGTSEDEISYQKTISLQIWLLGYEFPETLILITMDKVFFVTSQKKGKILETLDIKSDKQIPFQVFKRTKDNGYNAEQFKNLIDCISKSQNGKNVGIIQKDNFEGKFIKEWKEALNNYPTKFEYIDIASGLAAAMAPKDEEEIRNIKMAAKLSSIMMKNYFTEEMTSIIDEEKQIKHEKFTENIENALDESMRSKLKFPSEASIDMADWCYPPIVQSGGVYDLRPSAVSNNDYLHAGTIICSLGVRYKSYCTNISRTFLIDPKKTKEKNYIFLVQLQNYLIDHIRDGILCKDLYQLAKTYVQKKRPDLEQYFPKNIGFVTGIEFRESTYVIKNKNNRELKAGMIINLVLGLQNIEDTTATNEKNKVYSLLLSDTIRITHDMAVVLTDAKKDFTEISFFFQSDEPQDKKEVEVVKDRSSRDVSPKVKTAIISAKTRGEENDEMSADQRRRLHQQQLAAQKQSEGLQRFSEGNGAQQTQAKTIFKRYESYRKETQLPKQIRSLQIVVDERNESIILPIYGFAVPFHISTIKNISKNDEGEFIYLRFNFITPGQTTGKKDESMPFEDTSATFIRSISYRSAEHGRFTEIYKSIVELKKNVAKREAERKEMADLVVQDKLIEIRARRPPRLGEVFARPALEGKRLPGDIEIHTNGIRYQGQIRSDQKIDLLFSNIKHLFFQPCDNELIVIIHIHLKNPIMIGKKKTKDVQFYREVTDASYDETGNRRRRYNYGDEDELAAEHEERQRRKQLNREFQGFAEKIQEMSNGLVEVDIPYRRVGFYGVPHRQLVLLQPTTECLVHLTDPPYLVITLNEIEIAHLERVQFGLKNFDLVFVFKDFQKTPIHINTIPMAQLDNVKEWLDSMDIAFTEGPVNLNWSAIMKTINENPAAFFEDGGWKFLSIDTDDEDDVEEEEEESEYELSEEDEYSSSESDYSSDESSSSSSGSEEESEESGEDWDELEKKAERDDQKRKRKEEASTNKRRRS